LNEPSPVEDRMVVRVFPVWVFGVEPQLLTPFQLAHEVVILPFVNVVVFQSLPLQFGLVLQVVVSFDVL